MTRHGTGVDATGYLSPVYAQAWAEFGAPRFLPASGGWLLARPIPHSPWQDAMGCYPLFACRDWSRLEEDLVALGEEFVSVTLVADPLGAHDVATLRAAFPDLVRPFKAHFVIDLSHDPVGVIAPHHRRNAHKALQQVRVQECAPSAANLATWVGLYNHLIARHHIRGLAAFSPAAFAGQWQTPGLRVWQAQHAGEVVGMTLWLRQGEAAYYHLAAYTPQGYTCRASFALFWEVIHCWRAEGEVRWLNLGAGAGLNPTTDDGLTRFKRGWATETRPAYLCGRIGNPTVYAALTAGDASRAYFPAYRRGEFA